MTNEIKNTSAFPPPPDEYKAFTSEEAVSEVQPPQPPKGPFSVFGKLQSADEQTKSLEEQGIPVMYDESAPILLELKRINHRILFAFQRLVGIIAEGNESTDQCLEEIKNLFLNAHSILHKLRSAQAYEHMHYCLRKQTQQLEEFKKDFENKLNEIANLSP